MCVYNQKVHTYLLLKNQSYLMDHITVSEPMALQILLGLGKIMIYTNCTGLISLFYKV